MRISSGIAAGLLALCAATAAHGQQMVTVGDVLDRGGKKLSKEEVRQLVSGATIAGVQGGNSPNISFQSNYSPSGSVNGDVWNKGTWITKMSGNWSVNDSAQLCVDLVNSQGTKVVGCQSYYTQGNTYYGAQGDARTATVNERKVTR